MVQTVLAADPVITQDTTVNGCNGVVTTPGSENTLKRYVSGSLEPGGTATFEISFPVDAADVGGDFRITDCVFIDDVAVAKYFIDFVPNNEDFILTFTLNIPSNAPVGDEFCNYAKTTASPSASQASNRKAGPACFIIGGALRVTKVDGAGQPLAGATFSVACQWPTSASALSATVVAAEPNGSVTDGNDAGTTAGPTETFTSTSGGTLNVSATTGSAGTVAVQAPIGTVCTFTETAPPPGGYVLPADPDCTITVILGQQGTCNFVNILPIPDVGVTKSASQTTVLAPFAGLIYTLTASNSGTGAATGVIISDNLDDDLVVVSATFDNDPGTAGGTGNCTVGAGNTISCAVGTLAASDGNATGAEPDTATATITVNVPVAACPSVQNQSSVSATNEAVGQQGNNSSAVVTVTVNCPDASVSKTSTDPTIIGGDSAAFSITVNGGALGTAAAVTLSDTLPSGFTWTVGGANIGDCSAGGPALVAGDTLAGGTVLTCDFGILAPNATRTITLTATTTLAACESTISNTATISVAGDTFAGNNTSTATITVDCPDASVTKDAVDATIVAGESAAFTVVVTAGGDGDSENVVLTDLNPAGSGRTWTVSGANSAACTDLSIAPGETLTCNFGTIPEGQSRTITITTTSSIEDCEDGIANTVQITATVDVDPSDNQDSASIVVECPDASVVKESVNAVIDAGTNASFTIVVSADGDTDSENVVLTDLNPAGSGRTWTVSGANSGACTDLSIAPGETLTCNFGTIPDGQSRTITITTTSSTADCAAAIANTASITSAADIDLSNNQDSASIVVECPGLNLLKSATTGEVVAGQVARFEIRVWNAGPGDALNATVHDDLPAGLSWNVQLQSPDGDDSCSVSSSTTPGGATQVSFDCTFGTLPVTTMAGGKLIVVTATTDNTDCGVLNNTASADASNHGAPLTSSASITVRCPTLVVDKVASIETITISGPANALVATPSVVTWTISYTLANGPVTGAVITDLVPTGFTFLDAANGGTFASGTVTWNLGTLTTSGSVSFRTTVNPATISRTGPTVNTAIIDSNETAPDNGQDSVTVTVVPPPLGSTPTPRPPLPNTATGIGIGGAPVTVPVELLVVFFIGSLGALALANVRASSRRR